MRQRRSKKLFSMVVMLCMVLSLLPIQASAAYEVSTLGDLQTALSNSEDNIVLTRTITIDSDTTLNANTATTITVDGTFRHFTITSEASLTLGNITLKGNSDTTGGGIIISNGTLTLDNGTNIINCNADKGGGVYAIQGNSNADIEININTGASISGNTATDGGGLWLFGENVTLNVNGGTIENNYAETGGGITASVGNLIFSNDAKICDNEALTRGGGLIIFKSMLDSNYTMQVSMTDTAICNNEAKFGAGIYAGNTIELNLGDGTKIYENEASAEGGGIYAWYKATIILEDGSSIYENTAGEGGGGVALSSSAQDSTIIILRSGSKIEGNSTVWSGGGIKCMNCNIEVQDGAEIIGNTANYGGGIYINNYENLTVEEGAIFQENLANAGSKEPPEDWDTNPIYSSIAKTTTSSVIDDNGVYVHPLNNYDIVWTNTQTYTITYQAGEGTGEDRTIQAAKGYYTLLKADELGYSKSNYNFSGWIDENAASYADGATIALDGNITLVAQWTKIPTTSDTSSSDSSSTSYTVSFDSNGGTAVSSKAVSSGSPVTKPTNPTREGYTFIAWYSDSALTTEYDFSKKVSSSFTLYAKWSENREEPEVYIHQPYIYGYNDGSFHPDDAITRAELSQLLYNISNASGAGTNVYSDVSSDKWYYNAITYLSDRSVIYGYTDGSFRPDNEITRAEFVALIVRYAGLTESNTSSFSDVSSNDWAAGYIGAASQAGYINGYTDGSFRPDNAITRGEAVTILNAMLGRTIDKSTFENQTMPFSDVPSTHWAYDQILEAAVEHEHTA